MGRPRKIQTELFTKKEGEILMDKIKEQDETIRFLKTEAGLASERAKIIMTQQQQISGLKADINGMSIMVDVCQQRDKEIVKDLKIIIEKMKSSFSQCSLETGNISIQDVDYNLDLIYRILANKYNTK
jgi:hypothetical protein